MLALWDEVGNLTKSYMLIGEYTHTLDDKKRVSLPVKFRKELGKKVVLTRGLDNCLFIYGPAEWKRVAGHLANLSMGQSDSRGFTRFMLSGAVETDVDSLGRILVPDFLKDFAGLGTRIVLIGVSQHVEIWDEKTWGKYRSQVEREADSLAEKLGEVGAI